MKEGAMTKNLFTGCSGWKELQITWGYCPRCFAFSGLRFYQHAVTPIGLYALFNGVGDMAGGIRPTTKTAPKMEKLFW